MHHARNIQSPEIVMCELFAHFSPKKPCTGEADPEIGGSTDWRLHVAHSAVEGSRDMLTQKI